MPMYKPVRMGLQQPVRMFAKHINIVHAQYTPTQGTFQSTVATFFPLSGDNILNGTLGQRVRPANWTTYSNIYSTVRIHGVKIDAYFTDLAPQNEGETISTFYSLAGPNDKTVAADPYNITTVLGIDNMLQQKGMRKNRMLGDGTGKTSRTAIHRSGYWSIKRIQSELSLDNDIAELEVNADGSVATPPDLNPQIIHKIVPARQAGFSNTNPVDVRYVVTLYCDWFSRRRAFDPTFTIV